MSKTAIPEVTVHATITGRVQGVGYRAWTVGQAQIRSLNGWVRNRREGTVEAIFSGRRDVINDMLEACKDGPEPAEVKDVTVTASEETVQPGFVAKPTA